MIVPTKRIIPLFKTTSNGTLLDSNIKVNPIAKINSIKQANSFFIMIEIFMLFLHI